MTRNIFGALATYEKDENYWTSALVYLLEYLWNDPARSEEQRGACARFLSKLSDAPFSANEDIDFDVQKVVKKTEETSRSVIDARISSDSKYIGIEIKDTSGLNQEPEDYKQRLLEAAGERDCRLVLLRRSGLTPKEFAKVRGVAYDVRWFEIYSWIQEMRSAMQVTGASVGCYLLAQFSEFLNEKGVPIMTRVTKDGLAKGLAEIPSLLNMVQQWAESAFENRGLNAILTKHFVEAGRIGFGMGQRRDAKDEECYLFYVETDNATNLIIDTTERAVAKLERKNVDCSGPQELEKHGLGKYIEDNVERIYAHRPLTSVLQKDSEKEQYDEVHRLLDRMFQELDCLKVETSKKPRRH
jgi:hypothetical protein